MSQDGGDKSSSGEGEGSQQRLEQDRVVRALAKLIVEELAEDHRRTALRRFRK